MSKFQEIGEFSKSHFDERDWYGVKWKGGTPPPVGTKLYMEIPENTGIQEVTCKVILGTNEPWPFPTSVKNEPPHN